MSRRMDDTLQNVTLGLLALFAIHGSLEQRARRGAERQVSESFNHTGQVRARLAPRGLLGLEASDFYAVDVYGEDLQADRLPFYVYPRKGWKGSIRHLRLHLRRFTLADLPIRLFDADIPFATFDIGHALYKSRLVLRGTGSGPAAVAVDAQGLTAFIKRKFSATLSDVTVSFPNHKVLITGKASLFSALSPITTTGVLVPREGRYLELAEPEIRLNGVLLSPQGTAGLLKQINPVLDTDKDLGLGGYFVMERVEVGEDEVIITGRATIPNAPPDALSPSSAATTPAPPTLPVTGH